VRCISKRGILHENILIQSFQGRDWFSAMGTVMNVVVGGGGGEEGL
jgi:hypothetical protein